MTGLYVHVPFCSIKCFYCDFAAFSGQGRTVSRYLRALAKEAALAPRVETETLYIGGGTPSELSARQTEELFELLRTAYPDSRWEEVTFEANPESLTAEKIAVLGRSGVTRLSLGVQTLDAGLLKGAGRHHSPEDAVRAFRQARAGGLAVSIDLMYGLPGQTLDHLEESLRRILELAPEHVSLYGLHVEDRTLFSKRKVESDEDLGREMYERALDLLSAAGLRQYEISNFAKSGHESRHNINYWNNGEYLGLGCSAASYLGGERRSNAERLVPYCERVESGQLPVAESERLSGLERLGETIWLGLRKIKGLTLSSEMRAAFEPAWRRLTTEGLVQLSETSGRARARLTREGVFLANEVFQEFIPPF